jgi:hypothetical protein
VKNLQPRYTVTGGAGQKVYNLVAGPVASKAEATKLCAAMAQKGVACEIGTFRGNAL